VHGRRRILCAIPDGDMQRAQALFDRLLGASATGLWLTIIAILTILAVCALSGVGSAQRRDLPLIMFGPAGSQLLEICSEPPLKLGDVVPNVRLVEGAKNIGMCGGYIAGVNDNQASHVALGEAPTYCLPDGVEIYQLVKVVRKYLEDNPAKLHLPSGILVESALNQAFPCR
jgi:hypothetical protein